MREPLRVPRDIRQNALALAVNLAVLAASTYPFHVFTGRSWVLWLAMSPSLALLLYRLARGLLDREPVLCIDDNGILDRRLEVGLIPWEQITTIRRQRGKLTIGLSDPVRLGLRHTLWSRLNRSFGTPRDIYELRIRVRESVAQAKRVEERLMAEATDRGITKLP